MGSPAEPSDIDTSLASIFGPGHTRFGHVPVGEEYNGMNVLSPHVEWDKGGPFILLSEWWIRAHWGRAFEILEFPKGVPHGPPPLYGQGVVVMRRRPDRSRSTSSTPRSPMSRAS